VDGQVPLLSVQGMTALAGIKRGRMSAEENAAVEAFAAGGMKPGRVAQKLNRHPARSHGPSSGLA